MISIVCWSFVRLVNKMLTEILRLIATSCHLDMWERSHLKLLFIYDEEVTIRKRKSVLRHFEVTEACKQHCIPFLPWLWDGHMLFFGRFDGSVLQSTIEIVCFCSTGFICFYYGPRREKTCLQRFANNTGADQPAHTRSLISAFVFRFLESSIC